LLGTPNSTRTNGRLLSYPVIAGSVSILAASYNLAIISVGLQDIQKTFALDSTQLTVLASIILVGAIFGSVISGILSDRLGRLGILTADMVTFVAAGILSSISVSFTQLIIFRFLVGIGVGMDYVIVFAYIAEIYHRSGLRGARMATILFFANFGILMAYVSGAFFDYSFGMAGWRYAAISGAVFSIVPIILRSRLRETDLWKGLRLESFRRIAKDSFKGKRKNDILRFSIPWFLYQISDQSLAIILPLVLIPILGLSAISGSVGSVFVKLFTIPASFLTILMIERLGRRLLQSVGFLLRGILLLSVGIMLFYSINASPILLILILGLAFFFGAFGPDKTTVIMPAEKYETEVRATSQGFSEAAGRFGGIVGIFGYAMFSVALNGGGIMFLAVTCLAGGVITHFFIKETRHNNSLEPKECTSDDI